MKEKVMEVERSNGERLSCLFGEWEDTLVWSYLQGVMGRGWIETSEQPTCGRIITGDFMFLAGDAKAEAATKLLTDFTGEIPKCLLIIADNEEWYQRIKDLYPDTYDSFTRYAFYKEADFDKERLKGYMDLLVPQYEVKKIDASLYEACMAESWSEDLCSQFHDCDDYLKRGRGYCILHNGEVVCGASSYTVFNKGIEIEIDTKKEYRKQNLATICASALILDCLEDDIFPSWDAANMISVKLAEKLGYKLKHPYTTYIIDRE